MPRKQPAPKPAGPLRAPDGYFWGSCTVEQDWYTGRHRHLIRTGGIDTRCGASASGPDIWVTGHSKKQCPKCIETLTPSERAEVGLA